MTMWGTLEVLLTAVREGMQIDRRLFAESPEKQAIWQVNCPLSVYLQMVMEVRVFVFKTWFGHKAAGPPRVDPRPLQVFEKVV